MKKYKKIIKWLLLVAIAIAVALGAYLNTTKPLTVKAVKIERKEAYSYITETSYVSEPKYSYVYPILQGKLVNAFVHENDSIKKGDRIAEIDVSSIQFQIDRMKNNIEGYKSQKNNLYLQEQKEKDSLRTSRVNLAAQLAVLDATKNDSKQQEQNAKTERESQIEVTNLLIEQAKLSLENALTRYENARSLHEAGLIPKSELDAATEQKDLAQSLLEQNEAKLKSVLESKVVSQDDFYNSSKSSINAQIATIDSQLSKSYQDKMAAYYDSLIKGEEIAISEASDNISDKYIVSPASGIIEELNLNSNVVSPAVYVAKIKTDDKLVIEAHVSTLDIDSVHLGDTVYLKLDKRDDDLTTEGKVTKIDDKAENVTSQLGVDDKKVKIEIEPNDTSFLKEGYSYDVDIPIYKAPNMILVPKEALFKLMDDYFVFVIENDTAVQKKVTKGIDTKTETVILEGLTDGEVVIVNADADDLKPDVKVKPVFE